MKIVTPKIFVDTAIFRYAASVKLIQSAKLKDGTITTKNGETRTATILVYENKVKKLKKADICLEKEKLAIIEIANLARNSDITLYHSHEVNLELLFQPEVDLTIGRMYGAPCHIIHSPLLKVSKENFNEYDKSEFPYVFWGSDKVQNTDDVYKWVENELFRLPVGCFPSRLNFRSSIIGLRETLGLKANAAKFMFPFLISIESKRYNKILELLDVDFIREENKNNLFLDAYHLWTAEESKCDYFVSTDGHLLNKYKSSITEAISPTNLQALLMA